MDFELAFDYASGNIKAEKLQKYIDLRRNQNLDTSISRDEIR